jgi:hypothetical protein
MAVVIPYPAVEHAIGVVRNPSGSSWCMPAKPKSGGTLKSERTPIRSVQTGRTILRNVRFAKSSESIAMKQGLIRHENRLRSRGTL